jgi:hypothetical protein
MFLSFVNLLFAGFLIVMLKFYYLNELGYKSLTLQIRYTHKANIF